MNPKIIFQEISQGGANLEKQRRIAHSLLFDLTGKKIKHSKTGRPIIDRSVDVSISHKNDLVCAGIVPEPYRIGVDVEHIKNKINAELFFGSLITKSETFFLKTFCENNNISASSGVAIFWSVKEAFFKCLGCDLTPGRIRISGISKNGKVVIDYSDEIKLLMADRGLRVCLAKTIFDEKHVRSHVVMKNSRPEKLSTVSKLCKK